ncbi:uncharacterized protein LOC117175454 [Belonocnema kinseyi]|uniref:uncharacterized protein LOC117175454 n=1 Tax=Belonocnema kinseyi TaxID=2817044 RepID=UPI00143DF609|nr:uncharacterized protein LOC117175454 [Belonocnema kinseyi]
MRYDIPMVLNQLIFVEKLFTLDELNLRLPGFDYGENDNINKPLGVSENQIKPNNEDQQQQPSLVQSSSQRLAKIKVFKARISNAQRMLANFEKLLADYVPERDFPVLEIREKELAFERENFDKFISEMELLEDDSDYGNVRTKFDESYFSCYNPEFHKPSDIDILIGVKLFYKLLCVGQIELKNHPNVVLQKTQLGWIVTGEINSPSPTTKVQCHLAINSTPLDSSLTKFWEVEEIPKSKLLSAEERACEVHFANNTQRDATGRYIVKLPFNENKGKLGDSLPIASRRFAYLENRFVKNPELKKEYSIFLEEYETLNHMSLIKNSNSAELGFYLPHHAVVKSDSLTTKIRVVFDGSAKTSSGISLNDSLMVGPTIQDDLFSLLTRFRTHKYALTADIEKMYRQVLVHTDDAVYQKILSRENQNAPIKIYSLNTVTYGTSRASFLATRALHQLANDEGAQHPIAAAFLKRDFYVDDLLTGASTWHEAAFLRNDLSKLLEKGGFPLRKWASNDPTLLSDVPVNPSDTHMSLDPKSTIKTLGIQWNPRQDFIFYSVNLSDCPKQVTKRSILSQVAKLFDPLGLLGPVIVKAKIIIQLLWKAGVSWDGSIPLSIHTMWTEYKEQLPLLSDVRFDCLILAPDYSEIQMHGFSDASEKA